MLEHTIKDLKAALIELIAVVRSEAPVGTSGREKLDKIMEKYFEKN